MYGRLKSGYPSNGSSVRAFFSLLKAASHSSVHSHGGTVDVLSRPQVDLASLRQEILAQCQRLRVIVLQLLSCLCGDVISTCVWRRLREQCLRSKITSVARVEIVLLLRFVAGNVDVNTLASKCSEMLGNADILRMRRVIHNDSTCVCLRIPVAAITQKRKDASVDLWPALVLRFPLVPHPVVICPTRIDIINSSVPFLAMLSCRRHKHQHDKYEY